MNTEALFLFLILLLGLVLCSFLGGNCNKEGLTNNNTVYNGPNGATATMSTNSSGTPIITLNQTNGSSSVIFTQSSSNSNLYTNPFGFSATLSNGNIVIAPPNNGPTQTFTPSSSSSSSSIFSSLFSSSPSTSSSNNTVYNGPNGATATMSTNSSGTPIITLTQTNGSSSVIFTQSSSNTNLFTNPFGFSATLSNGNLIITSPNNGPTQTFTPSSSSSSSSSPSSPSSSSSSSSNNYDNYDHYSGTGSSTQLQNGMTFTDASGDTIAVITNSNGTQSLQLTSVGQSTPMVLNSTPPSNSNVQPQPNTFYAPFGGVTATVITDSNSQTAIQVSIGSNVVVFSQSGSSSNSSNPDQTTSTQYYGSTGNPIQTSSSTLAYGASAGSVTGPYGNTAYYAQGPNGNTIYGTTNQSYNPYATQYNGPYGGSAGYAQGPYGNTVGYAQGPYGNTIYGSNTSSSGYGNQYSSALPSGVPASQIPPGQEDLYILKSEIVPPVCPACPKSSACPRQEPCPPCPACARCPEPAFECKKVPNYNAISDQYLPQPVLNDFSQFGM